MTTDTLDALLAKTGRCVACATPGGTCGCVILPAEFRRLGFSGLFHLEAALEPGAYEAFAAKVPCLVSRDRWVLASVDAASGTGVLVRRDSAAIVEAFTRPGGAR